MNSRCLLALALASLALVCFAVAAATKQADANADVYTPTILEIAARIKKPPSEYVSMLRDNCSKGIEGACHVLDNNNLGRRAPKIDL